MLSWRKKAIGWVLILGGLALGGGALHVLVPDRAAGQQTVVRVQPATQSVGSGATFAIDIVIENVSNLGTYEWQLSFNPALVGFVNVVNGPFLGSSGREVSCQPPIVGPVYGQGAEGGSILVLAEGNVRFACVTSGLPPPDGDAPPGASGSGLLSTVTLSAVAPGATNLDLVWVSLGDPTRDVNNIPSQRQGGCVAIGAGASCASPTVAPPAYPTPPVTPTPGGAPTATPTGPIATPTPLPPGFEAIALVEGCQFEAWTGGDGTMPGELAGLVDPGGNLVSLWAQQPAPVWRGYSPQFPEVSDLGPVNLLDVVAICARGPAVFVRPII